MQAKHSLDRHLAQAARICAVGATGIALVNLIFSWSGDWLQLNLGSAYVPMAPGAAVLMLLLGAAALLSANPQPTRVSRCAEIALAVFVLGSAIWMGVDQRFNQALAIERWLSGASLSASGGPGGRMAPLTMAFFAITAATLLCARLGAGRWEGARALGGILSLTVFVGAGAILAGFVVRTPFLYGALTVPMALFTAVAFTLVSTAILLAGGSEVWPTRMFLRAVQSEPDVPNTLVEWPLLLVFGVLTLGISTAGMLYLKHAGQDAQSAAYAGLETISAMKIQQIVNWRKARFADADFIRATADTSRHPWALRAGPDAATTRADRTAWLKPMLFSGAYHRAILLDPDLKVKSAVPEGTTVELSVGEREAAAEALRTGQTAVADLHREAKGNHVLLGFAVPLRLQDPPKLSLIHSNVAVVLLQVDAADFLYPLIQSWPAKSATAETLLVRREGDQVVFLNELRHLKGSALKLRRPLDESQLPAAMGLRRQLGIRTGVDYRGVRVAAVTHPVPDTDWVLVAKMDEEELFAPLRNDILTSGGVVLALLLASVLSVTVLWRRRNEQFLQQQLAVERARLALAERFEHLMKNASDAILLGDEQDNILEGNDQALALYGFSLPELQAMKLPELRGEESRAAFTAKAEELAVAGEAAFETIHRRKDGSTFPVEVSSRLVEIGGARYKLGIIRDITQRKAHEAEIERLNRLYATLSQVNQAIVRCHTRETLFAEVCRVVVEFGQFHAAWIGSVQPDGRSFKTVAHCTIGDQADLAMPGWEGGCGVMEESVSTGHPCVCVDSQTDGRTTCCRQVLISLGVKACAAFPLRVRGVICSSFGICSTDSSFFNADETRLLEEIAADITFALDKLDKEEQSRAAAESLRASEKRFRSLAVATSQIIWSLDGQGRVNGPQPSFQALTGQSDAEIQGEGWMSALHLDDVVVTLEAWREAAAAKAGYEFECRLRRHDGVYRCFVARCAPVVADDGTILEWIGTCTDVTERKQAEAALQRQTNELRLRNEELIRFNSASVGRELRMIELKKQVNELCRQLNKPLCYPLAFGPQKVVRAGGDLETGTKGAA